MKILFVADAFSDLSPKGDTSLAILQAALKKNHECYWGESQDLNLDNARVSIRANRCLSIERGALPKTAPLKTFPISLFDSVWIRKDPPFDANYSKLCWLLSLEEKNTLFVNKPSLLLRYHEKMIPMEAHRQGFLDSTDILPAHVGNTHSLSTYLDGEKSEEFISKPFLGYGGRDIQKVSRAEVHEAIETGTLYGELENRIIQPFVPAVQKTGDRRVIFLNENVLSHVVRMPKPGDYVSNFAQGGSGQWAELTKKETKVCEQLGRFLKSIGIVFAGADFIDERLSEVNVTSPTGLRAFENLENKDYAIDIIEWLEAQI